MSRVWLIKGVVLCTVVAMALLLAANSVADPLLLLNERVRSARAVIHVGYFIDPPQSSRCANGSCRVEQWFTNFDEKEKLQILVEDRNYVSVKDTFGTLRYENGRLGFSDYDEFFETVTDPIKEIFYMEPKPVSTDPVSGAVTYKYRSGGGSRRYLKLAADGTPIEIRSGKRHESFIQHIDQFEILPESAEPDAMRLPDEAMAQFENGIPRDKAVLPLAQHRFKTFWLGSKADDFRVVNVDEESGGMKSRRASLFTYISPMTGEIIYMISQPDHKKNARESWSVRPFKTTTIDGKNARYTPNGGNGLLVKLRIGGSQVEVEFDRFKTLRKKQILQMIRRNLEVL